MVVHIGSKDGFLRDSDGNDVALINRGKISKQDYHKNMNSSKFEDYMIKKVLPNLPDHSVVVLDNCSYHKRIENKKPAYSGTRKQVFIAYLRKNGDEVCIFFSPYSSSFCLPLSIPPTSFLSPFLTNSFLLFYSFARSFNLSLSLSLSRLQRQN